MLYAYIGTDRAKVREALDAEVKKLKGKMAVLRITDASSVDDLRAALGGAGMFGEKQAVILDGVFANADMRPIVESLLPMIGKSEEFFFILEEKPDAATRKMIEKYAESSKRFDKSPGKRDSSVFALANSLRRGDKKNLWIGLQKEFGKGEAAEALHGVLFWGAKQALLSARSEKDIERGRKLVAALAELPHESRRRGIELEYALEKFALSGA